ncbi:protein RGF1 INDUCIBLE TRANSCRIPTION FACTOR 1-like [Bidens hawaiensis]|uniref:protein RGF1 INDUCIBLE TRANSCRIPTION FACTOR 1-like n=1 Tax=Bidens hawaiensis TaxID=980011 RepID=UPI00404A31E1
MYCLDCNDGAFCLYCKSSKHKEHHVIQIRRSSYHDVVRVSEIEKVLNIDGVQTYVINSAKVLFLNKRPQPKLSGKTGSKICQVCGRSLLDMFLFCSLGCKLVGIKRNENARFILERKSSTTRGMSSSRTRRIGIMLDDDDEEEHHHIYTHTPSTRRRKGIPHRAPN